MAKQQKGTIPVPKGAGNGAEENKNIEKSSLLRRALGWFWNENLSTKEWKMMLIITITAFGVHSSGIYNETTNLDDNAFFYQNERLKNPDERIFTTLTGYNYIPVTNLFLALLYKIDGGLHPLGLDGGVLEKNQGANVLFMHGDRYDGAIYHISSAIINTINGLLIFLIFRRITKKPLTAFLTVFFWSILPTHVESVAWISEMRDVLFMFFGLLATLRYVKDVQSAEKTKHWGFITAMILLSCGSKGQAVWFCVSLILIDIFVANRKLQWGLFWEKRYLWVISIIFGSIAIYGQSQGAITHESVLEHLKIGSYAFLHYPRHMFLPWPDALSVYYPYYKTGSISSWYLLILPSFGLLIYWLYHNRNHDFARIASFGLGWYVVHLFFQLQLFSAIGGAVMADRYTYVPSMGLTFILANITIFLFEKYTTNRIFTIVLFLVSAIYTISLAATTYKRGVTWKDSKTVAGEMIEKNPGHYLGYILYGQSLIGEADMETRALQYLDKGISMHSTSAKSIPDAHISRGNLLRSLQEYSSAVNDYDSVLKYKADHVNALEEKGMTYALMGNYDEALKNLLKSLSLNHDVSSDLYLRIGNVYILKTEYKNAIGYYSKALAEDEKNATAWLQRYRAYAFSGKFCEAWSDAKKFTTLGFSIPQDQTYVSVIENASYCK